jgi:hypothetical protein
MNYDELVNDSLLYFEKAKKRNLEIIKSVKRSSTKLQLEKEIEAYTHLKGFWDQENKRIQMMKKYSQKWNNSL